MLAASVWQGGHARRRALDDAIAATALPAWRRTASEGGAISLAGVAAFLAAAYAGLAIGRRAAAPMATPLALIAGLTVTMVLGRWSDGGAWAMLPRRLLALHARGRRAGPIGPRSESWLAPLVWPVQAGDTRSALLLAAALARPTAQTLKVPTPESGRDQLGAGARQRAGELPAGVDA